MVTFLALLPVALWLWTAHIARRWRGFTVIVYLVLAGVSASVLMAGVLVYVGAQQPTMATLQVNGELIGREPLMLMARALIGGSLAALFMLLPMVRRLLARVLPLKPGDPVHATALVLACYAITLTMVQTPLLDVLLTREVGLPPSELVGQALGMVVIAFAGVGFGVTRSWSETVARLGLTLPGRREVQAAAVGAVVLLGLQAGLGAVWVAVSPESMERVNNVTRALLGNLFSPWGALLIGVSAGIGEELVFRGALQPRFGLIATSALFAVVHLQYIFTFALAIVFLLGLGLGILRQRWNTTVAILAHMFYNTLLVLISISFPAGGP